MAWMLLNNSSDKGWLEAYSNGFTSRVINYFPVGMAWLLIMFYDTDLTRDVFTDIATLSMWGPWENHWAANADFFIAGLEEGNGGNPWFWVWTAIYVTWTLVEQVLQIMLLPKVYGWTGNNSYVDSTASALLSMF